MKKEHVVLTGCTGLIGQYLLKNLLMEDVPVVVIARSCQGISACRRIDALLAPHERQSGRSLPRPICLEGDLLKPGLGLKPSDRDWLASHAGSFFHNAANVTFNATVDGEPWRTNVDGTREMIELCRQIDVHCVHYMSTAFVCGDRQGTIYEHELDRGQEFGSDYERSKFTAETLLHEAKFDSLTVYRPSAVVGDYHTGFTSSYHGLYLYVQFTHLARQRASAAPGERWLHAVRLFCTGSEEHCLVPVDWVARAACEILVKPRLHDRTYHLTPLHPTRIDQVEAALQEYFHYYGVEFVGPRQHADSPHNDTEEVFYAAISAAEHRYWAGHPRFCTTNTQEALPELPCPRIDLPCLLRLFDFAVANRFGRSRRLTTHRRSHEPSMNAAVSS